MHDLPATRNSWTNIKFDKPKYVEAHMAISNEQFDIIRRGIIPEEMEDKWFIYYARGIIHFFRSWTGYEIFRAKIQKTVGGYLIDGFQVETNQEKYRCPSDEENIACFIGLFENVLFPFHSHAFSPGERRVLELMVSIPELFRSKA